MYSLKELLEIEKLFSQNKEDIFTNLWRESSYSIIMELIRQLKSYYDISYGFKTIETARKFAVDAHKGQMYGINRPYIYHLDKVVEILKPYGNTAVILGYLHDVIEDTDKTKDDVNRVFGKFISECVYKLSDPPGFARDVKKLLKNKELSRIKGEYEIVLIVKAADRLANLEEGGKINMYLNEHDDFRKAVYRPNLCDGIWSRIEVIIENAKK
jgi:(p)ppGpp synthase/HD superfamily hydrolase